MVNILIIKNIAVPKSVFYNGNIDKIPNYHKEEKYEKFKDWDDIVYNLWLGIV